MTAVVGASTAESIDRWQIAWQWSPSMVAAIAVAAVIVAVACMRRGRGGRAQRLTAFAARIAAIGILVAMLSGLRTGPRSGMPAATAEPFVPSLYVRAPRVVRLGDRIGIDVEAVLPPDAAGSRAVAELVDDAGEPIASATLLEADLDTPPAGSRPPRRGRRAHGRIVWRPGAAGMVSAAVRIRGEDALARPPVMVRVVDEPLRVFLLDRPRFESRFLSRLLDRDEGSRVEVRMLTPDSAGGDAVRVPSSREDWSRFDVVLIGSVDPSVIGESAAAALVEAAVNDGVGILWSLDAGSDLEAVAVSPIGRLLPFRGRSADPPFTSPSTVAVTRAGGRAAWLAVADDDRASREAWGSMPEVYSPIRPSAIRPTARVMATCRPAADVAEGGVRESPFILVDRAGEARVVAFLAETWRLRQGARGSLVDRLLSQAMLHAAEPHLASRLLDVAAPSSDGKPGPSSPPSNAAGRDVERPLWNHPAMLVMLLAACMIEWWIRGRMGEGP